MTGDAPDPATAWGALGTWALCAAGAFAFVLIFPPYDVWPLAPIVPALLGLAAVDARRLGTFLLAATTTQLAAWGWLEGWVMEVSVAGWPGFAAVLTAITMLGLLVLRRLARDPRTGRLPLAVLVPLSWTAAEAFRGQVAFDGYPWYYLAHAVVSVPALAQSADLAGALVVTFLAAAVGGAAADVVRLRRGRGRIDRRVVAVAVAAVIAACGVNLVYGIWRLGQSGSLSEGPRILAIQTNLPMSNKIRWPLERQIEDFAGFRRQTFAAVDDALAAGTPPDLVAWPETMLPGFGLEPETVEMLVTRRVGAGDLFSSAIVDLAAILETPLLVGSPVYTGLRIQDDRFVWDRHHNSVYLIAPGRPLGRYDKLVLTPFGEVMPYISAWPWLEERMLAIGASGMTFDLDAGEAPRRLPFPWTGATREAVVATPICFEDTVAWLCSRLVHEDGEKVVDVLVNLSNDGWFGRHDSARGAHQQAARYRCIENRVPLVRVVNTGASASIDSCGRLVPPGPLPPRVEGALLAETVLDARTTLHARIGDACGWSTLALTAALALATIRRSTTSTVRKES